MAEKITRRDFAKATAGFVATLAAAKDMQGQSAPVQMESDERLAGGLMIGQRAHYFEQGFTQLPVQHRRSAEMEKQVGAVYTRLASDISGIRLLPPKPEFYVYEGKDINVQGAVNAAGGEGAWRAASAIVLSHKALDTLDTKEMEFALAKAVAQNTIYMNKGLGERFLPPDKQEALDFNRRQFPIVEDRKFLFDLAADHMAMKLTSLEAAKSYYDKVQKAQDTPSVPLRVKALEMEAKQPGMPKPAQGQFR
jgi:hypothetical protein